MNPGALQDQNVTLCPSVPYPPNGRLANANVYNNGCSLTVDGYPGHGDLGADGFPNGKSVPGRPLVPGDVIEVSPSFFSTPAGMAAKGDTGGLRYYAGEWTYVVGTGLRPWYGVQPRLMNAPLPPETLQGGTGSLSYDYADNGTFIFQQPHINVGMQNMQRFVEGRRLIHTNFSTGDHNEPGNDRYLAGRGPAGPALQPVRRASPATSTTAAARRRRRPTSGWTPCPCAPPTIDANGQQRPDPRYGVGVQMNGRSASRRAAGLGQQRARRGLRHPDREAGRRHRGGAAQAQARVRRPGAAGVLAARGPADARRRPARGRAARPTSWRASAPRPTRTASRAWPTTCSTPRPAACAWAASAGRRPSSACATRPPRRCCRTCR